MLKNTDKIKVLPNPWLLLASDGLPQCAVMREIGNGQGWICAKLDKSGKFVFQDEPRAIEASVYIRKRVTNGELILASAEHAPDLGITFVEPSKLLESYKAKAIVDYDAQHGDGAWEKNNAARVAAAVKPEDSTAEPTKAARKLTTEKS